MTDIRDRMLFLILFVILGVQCDKIRAQTFENTHTIEDNGYLWSSDSIEDTSHRGLKNPVLLYSENKSEKGRNEEIKSASKYPGKTRVIRQSTYAYNNQIPAPPGSNNYGQMYSSYPSPMPNSNYNYNGYPSQISTTQRNYYQNQNGNNYPTKSNHYNISGSINRAMNQYGNRYNQSHTTQRYNNGYYPHNNFTNYATPPYNTNQYRPNASNSQIYHPQPNPTGNPYTTPANRFNPSYPPPKSNSSYVNAPKYPHYPGTQHTSYAPPRYNITYLTTSRPNTYPTNVNRPNYPTYPSSNNNKQYNPSSPTPYYPHNNYPGSPSVSNPPQRYNAMNLTTPRPSYYPSNNNSYNNPSFPNPYQQNNFPTNVQQNMPYPGYPNYQGGGNMPSQNGQSQYPSQSNLYPNLYPNQQHNQPDNQHFFYPKANNTNVYDPRKVPPEQFSY